MILTAYLHAVRAGGRLAAGGGSGRGAAGASRSTGSCTLTVSMP